MPLPSKVQDTLARSLNNLTVVSDTVLHELAQTVPIRQADKLQLLLNKLLERAEAEGSSANAASSSAASLGPEVPRDVSFGCRGNLGGYRGSWRCLGFG